MRKVGSLLVVFSCSLSAGCAGYPGPLLWAGYVPPQENDFYETASAPPCPRIALQNLPLEDQKDVLAAFQEVCETIASPDFRDRVTARSWLASCEKNEEGQLLWITGAELYARYSTSLNDFSIVIRKPFLAEAQTDLGNRRIAIRGKKFAAWRSNEPEQRAELINTFAHELSHLVLADDGASFAYTDRGHGSSECPDDNLASYGIGEIAETVWIETFGQR